MISGMLRFFIGAVILGFSIPSAMAQSCSRAAGTPMEMQVHLSFDDSSASRDESASVSGIGVDTDPTHRMAGASGQQSQEFPMGLQVRVQLQDVYGGNLSETSPSGEGRASFSVCSRLSYRIRVYGPNIEEAFVENVEPGRGDRILNIELHHKRDRAGQRSDSATVSAGRLKVPRKAMKELEIGNQRLVQGKLLEARQHLEKAIALYPRFDQAFNNLGVVLMQSGDPQAGKRAFEKAVQINEHFARAYVNLAKIALDAKDFAKAHEFAQGALRSEPLSPGALFVGAESAYFSGSGSEAVAYTRTLHSLPHEHLGLVHFMSAKVLQEQNLPGQAMAEYELFLKEEPGDSNVPAARLSLLRLQSQAVSRP